MSEKIYFSKSDCPDKSRCIAMLKEYGTPEHVQKHCNAVGETAKAIAMALKENGLKINVELVSSAGYLHDIARVHKKHEIAGAEYLRSIGLEDVSEVIKDHTKHRINMDIPSLSEEDVLCIADRTVLEDRYVGPKKRMEYIKSKALLKYGQESEGKLDRMIEEFVEFVSELEVFIHDEIYNIVPEDIR